MASSGQPFTPSVAANLRPNLVVEPPKDTSAEVQLRFVEAQLYVGPHVPPSFVEAYERIKPGLGASIVESGMAQGVHRRDIEKHVIVGAERRSWFGLIIASVLSLAVIYIGYKTVMAGIATNNKSFVITGASVVSADIGALVTAFIYGRRQQESERESKQAMIEETRRAHSPKTRS